MAKRFTATEKWDKVWFRKLSPEMKCFWSYITDRCNHAGIWEVDFELAEMFIGAKLDIPEIKKVFSKQYLELNGGSRWFLKDFIEFQYNGELNPLNRAHLSIITILSKEGIDVSTFQLKEGAIKGLTRSIQGRTDMDMVKDKDKDTDKEGGMGEIAFEAVWQKYPVKDGRKSALRHFLSSVKNQDDFENIQIALENYLKSEKVKKGFIKNGSTWFNNWQDWVHFIEPSSTPEMDIVK
jgi:hypothetical protein